MYKHKKQARYKTNAPFLLSYRFFSYVIPPKGGISSSHLKPQDPAFPRGDVTLTLATNTNHYFLDTRARNSAQGRKDTTRRAVTIAISPVFGLRPTRADLSKILNVPKPANFTSSPFINDSHISSNIKSISFPDCAAVKPNLSRNIVAKSLLVIVAIFYTLIKVAPHVSPAPNAG